jgi:hypothetical protein
MIANHFERAPRPRPFGGSRIQPIETTPKIVRRLVIQSFRPKRHTRIGTQRTKFDAIDLPTDRVPVLVLVSVVPVVPAAFTVPASAASTASAPQLFPQLFPQRLQRLPPRARASAAVISANVTGLTSSIDS